MKRTLALLVLVVPGFATAQVPGGDGSSFALYSVPGIANVSGQNNTRFVSDVAVTNTASDAAFVVVGMVPASGFPAQMIPLEAGRTIIWRNVLQEIWGASNASGALSFLSDQRLIIRARTYNTAASGTFGVALPVYENDDFLRPGQQAHSLWVSQSPDPKAGYRTNVAVFFPDSGGGAATVRIFDGDGNRRGEREYALETAGFQQISVAGFSSPVPVARAEIEVTRGSAAGYSVVVDNVTGDSSLFPFEPLPAGIQDVLVNGVARASGKNNTFFRTDGRFFNPGLKDATVTVAHHANQESNPSPATASFHVPAGKLLDVTDVLGTLLGLPVGSSGALRFQSNAPVGILCRTSNVDPTGANPGTFGAQQKPVPLMSFLSSADAGALISAVRQDAGYRTNVGFAAGTDGASFQLTLRSAEGTTIAAAARSLGRFGREQLAADKIFAGTSIPADAQILVKVTQGSVDIFDASVDNGSGDSVVTPAEPLPADIPSSAAIGPGGGSVRSEDGLLTLKIPAGALGSPVDFSISQIDGAPLPIGQGRVYRISPSGLSFARDVLLIRRYPWQEAAGSAGTMGLAFSDGGSWRGVMDGSIDAPARTLTVPLRQSAPAATAREPLAGGVGVDWAGYSGYTLWPTVHAAVEGSTLSFLFEVKKLGPGSAQTRGARTVLLSTSGSAEAVYSWTVNGIPGGDSLSGTVDGSRGDRAFYRPPKCAPARNPVIVEVTVEDVYDGIYKLIGFVDIWARQWAYDFAWSLDLSSCSPGVGYVGFTAMWGNRYSEFFDLDDAMTVHFEQLAPLPNAQSRREPEMCPQQGCGYTRVSMGSFPLPSIDSITGAVEGVYQPLLNLVVKMNNDGIPVFTFSGSSCKPPDADRSSPQMGWGPRTESYTVDPGGLNDSRTEFRSVLGNGATITILLSIRPLKCSG